MLIMDLTQTEAKAVFLRGVLDTPGENLVIDDVLVEAGWVYSKAAPIKNIEVWLGERLLGPAH